ncbi:MAG: hypothetical protein F6K24_09980, partial [Okeania sp. SIO2D1]|nr:hypothetical protein [Okeania sp. SIO2D1]
EEWFEEWETGDPSFTLAGINDTGQQTTSQLSTRQYYKQRTRSGSMPFGRQSIEPIWYLYKYQVFLARSQETGDSRQEVRGKKEQGRCGER